VVCEFEALQRERSRQYENEAAMAAERRKIASTADMQGGVFVVASKPWKTSECEELEYLEALKERHKHTAAGISLTALST